MNMKEEFTAIDMANASADGFRAGQRAAQSAGVPDAEPVLIQAVAVTRDDEEEGLRLEWLLEGGIAEMEFAGQVLFAMPEANSLCDEDGSAHVYIAPPAAPTVKAEQVDCLYCQGHGEVTRTSGQTAESYAEHNEECLECKGTGLSPSLPTAGLVGVESWRDQILRENPSSEPGYWPDALIVAAMSREIEQLRAALSAQNSNGDEK